MFRKNIKGFLKLFLLVQLLWLLCIQKTVGDNLYKEGFYDYDVLPGGVKYPDAPNYPFMTSTNRLSDGKTSTSAFTVTSPRFPYYQGKTANVSDRYLRYANYKLAAEEQGVALIGAGDQEKETARLKITSKPNYQNMPNPTKTFPVYAAIKWNPSDFAIQEGENYNITVFGDQTGYGDQMWYDGGIRVNAQGYSSYFDAISNCFVAMGRCRPHLKKQRRAPDANWMSLVCAVGEFVRALTEVEPGKENTYRWMPLDESRLIPTVFAVGRTVEFRAIHSGQLICFANDAHTTYWNNAGKIDVTVTRVSWPPESGATYKDQLLPACDSAQIVYQYKNPKIDNSTIKCNPKGGGSGWDQDSIVATTVKYGSGAPDEIFADLPPGALV